MTFALTWFAFCVKVLAAEVTLVLMGCLFLWLLSKGAKYAEKRRRVRAADKKWQAHLKELGRRDYQRKMREADDRILSELQQRGD